MKAITEGEGLSLANSMKYIVEEAKLHYVHLVALVELLDSSGKEYYRVRLLEVGLRRELLDMGVSEETLHDLFMEGLKLV
jgi:hypothetical protein